ncbi:phage virion morphogenesis protein [Sphingopyxis sp. GW247-27LB]|uniref:phage virion morphogenesis protein n=1 Tax=Sphingopyxis sp. GW247-27LB TaxID=2012632 RepID=UPI000BA63DBF|nr:phage virion morphogenesis protein [Sphingopyxis sp. GW247-27LB]PAL25478.1 phage virion morphogenesis protein [Sphingopyxis sp. GW247-27LB]
MSGASFTFHVDGADAIEREMAALAAAGEDLTEFNQAFGLILESNVLDRFDRESAPDGSAWKKSARAKAEGGKTLTDTARLKGSITSAGDAREIRVGTNVVYAAIHQLGFSGAQKVSTHKRRISEAFGRRLKAPVEVIVPGFTRQMEMPARAYLGIGPEDRDDGADLFREFFAGRAPGLFAGGSA